MKFNSAADGISENIAQKNGGFVLIEVLIAVTILSVVLLSVYSGISSGINIIGNSKNYTRAMIIAKSLMNEFRSDSMKGVDMKDAPVAGYQDFNYDRVSERYENPMLGPLPINKTEIKVKWKYKGVENHYELTMIYQVK
ncbi:MAG TPA: prepilin-type N-terminal cleavage/methylation domain-containing protein [Spirochaetota bacterium]|nr:prepilin-type N-terminal cleavage/methylation domain-containing protein [Spirochaetota bacterium]